MERSEQADAIRRVVGGLQGNGGWVNLARLGVSLTAEGINLKQLGYQKLYPYLNEFEGLLEFKEEREGDRPPVLYARLCAPVKSDALTREGGEPEKTAAARPLQWSPSAPLRGLYHLGYITNETAAVKTLQRIVGDNVNLSDVVDFIGEEEKNERITYWERTREAPIKHRHFIGEKTAGKTIATPCKDRDGNQVLAFFTYQWAKKRWQGVFFESEKNVFNRLRSYNIGKLNFASLSAADEFIKKLHGEDGHRNLLPDEEWTFGHDSAASANHLIKTAYPILESYLRHYTEKLFDETGIPGHKNYGKVVFSKDGAYCLFNTGLLDQFSNDIFIYGDAVFNFNHRLVGLRNSVFETSKSKLDQRGFTSAIPQMASFFSTEDDNIQELVYDPKTPVDLYDSEKLKHIIEDNMDRFPESYRQHIVRKDFQRVASDLISAVAGAEKIALRNFRYVIPQWRPQKKKIQFLMPIFLDRVYGRNPDFALVLDKTGNYYVPETILTLSMAYTNARLLCKPGNTWLQPDCIDTDEDEDKETDEM